MWSLYAGKDFIFTIRSDMGQAHDVDVDLMSKTDLLNKDLFTVNVYTKPGWHKN